MGSQSQLLHILFFPFLAPGHMIPMIDIAKLFASRKVKVTILTTPANAPLIQPAIDRANHFMNGHYHHPITIALIPFPCIEAGLPEGCENCASIPSPDLYINFLNAVSMLRQPFDQVLTELAPDCIVTDMFFPWTYNVAAEHGIPRLVFHGMSYFALCAKDSVERHRPLEGLPMNVESVIIPGLPHRIELLRTQFVDFLKSSEPEFMEMFIQANESESRSYGVLVNSFKELEPEYVEHYRKVVGRKAWSIGPVALHNEDETDISRGSQGSIDNQPCLKWLESKALGSVVYVCFGSLSCFTKTQLCEIALGLEASGHPFIWVVRSENQEFLPEGYEERMEGRGLLVKEWAPQVSILNHRAVGGFVTHCGWNSCLEGVTAGLPFMTWPLFAEQFYNERMVVDVLRIAVSIGAEYDEKEEEKKVIEAAEVGKTVNELMGIGEDAESRRQNAGLLKEKALRAVEEGGSSYVTMDTLIKHLMHICAEKSEGIQPHFNFHSI